MRLLHTVISLLLTLSSALAADIVELDNGDRLTGTVESILDGRLKMKTPYAPRVDIDLVRVTRLVTESPLVVTLEGGEPQQATVVLEGDRLEIGAAAVSRAQLQRVEPIPQPVPDPSWIEGWGGGSDFGWVVARGNSEIRTLSLNVDPVRQTSTDKTTLGFEILNSRQDGETSADQWSLAGRYDRTINEGLFAYGLGQVAADDQQSLDLRTRQGIGLGYSWDPSEDLRMSFFGGVNAIQEKFTDLERLNNAEGLAAFELNALVWNGIELTTRAQYLPLFGEGRYQLIFRSGVRLPVLYGFTFGFNLADDFDSNPPRDAEKNDLKFLMTVGYKF